MKKVIVVISLLFALVFGCKINPAVLQAGGKVNAAKPASKKAEAFEQISLSDNMLPNPGFEDGTDGWTAFGMCQVDVTTTHVHSGKKAMIVTGRLESWQGAGINLMNGLITGKVYRASVWVSLDAGQSSKISFTLKRSDADGVNYSQVASSKIQGEEWVQLAGEFKAEASGDLKERTLYLEGPGAGINFYVDDAALAPAVK